MEIGKRIKDTRNDHDETQAQLANILQITRQQLQRYEKETQEMGIYKLIAICQHYGVSADYILGLPRGLEWPR